MSSKHETVSSVLNLLGILLLIFIVLKLLGLLAWSWWWVLSPFWIPTLIFFALCCRLWLKRPR